MASPLILSLSTVFALIGIVLVAIAFGTNNWQQYRVDRTKIINAITNNASIKGKWSREEIYFDRDYGLFRKCFPSQVPDSLNSYTDPLGGNCVNINDYQIPENHVETDLWTESQKTRMHLMRTCVAFYIVGLIFLFFCLLCGICGCWRRSPSLILATGILLLFATLFLAAAMAVWHGVDYLQREVINAPGFFKNWDTILKQNTEISYGWSYIIAWIGISFILISSVLMLAAYRAMKEEERDEFEKKRAPYMMTNYYDSKNAAMLSPYNYQQSYGYAYPGYNYAGYGGQQGAAATGNGYYGYLTYGR